MINLIVLIFFKMYRTKLRKNSDGKLAQVTVKGDTYTCHYCYSEIINEKTCTCRNINKLDEDQKNSDI